VAIVVRGPDGEFHVKEEPYVPLKERNKLLGIPVIRGVASFILSMRDGMRALTWSAEIFPEDESPKKPRAAEASEENAAPAPEESGTPAAEEGKGTEPPQSKTSDKILFAVSMVIGIALAFALFTLLPTYIGSLFQRWVGDGFLRNLIETLLRLALLVGYMLLVSRMKAIRRVFSYHGAEHKSIACFEAGEELTVENVKRHSRFHPRCGTSFLLMVVLVSMLVFLLMSSLLSDVLSLGNNFVRIGIRLAILPFVVGFSYEVNRFIGRHDNLFTRIIRVPGLGLQRITTNEPDDDMIEVGINALSRVIPKDKTDAVWGRE
ncbi:MAG: DUF1385 domain-containing protein, partial [Oscillospiraceae bacterium]|nr:DUF1385 domain-containing protein [Oscillospiraceae bacterium]